ncbi:MAG: tetratricopeptide repeat protein [Planctomycetales bacterium]|nr:tetratricopeptide repeat protein [Planctomycetales bacterium]
MATISEALAVAVRQHQAGQLHAAETIYRQILGVAPNHSDALHLLGVIAHQVGRPEDAIAQIKRAVAIKGDDPTYHSNLGAAYHAAGRYEEAAATCRQAVALQPDSPEAHNNLGAALKELDELDEAIVCYRRAIELNGAYVDAHKNLGSALWRKGNLVDAEMELREAVRLNPRLAEAHYLLGGVLKELKRPAEAVAAYEMAIVCRPDYAEALNNLGNLFRDGGQIDEAIALYDRALAANSAYAEAVNNKASAHAAAGRFDEALAGYQQALALKPEYAEAQYNQALSFAQLGQFEAASQSCQQTLRLDPNHARAYRLLLDMEREADPAEMLEKLESLLEGDELSREDRENLYFALGNLFDRRHEYERAFDAYARGNQLVETSFDAEKHAAHIQQIVTTFSAEFFASSTLRGSESERPVFIVGMPRSGTTLVEQILCSHPQIFGAGELDTIHRLSESIASRLKSSLPYPSSVAGLETSHAAQLATEYLAQAGSRAGDEARITDKMPSNFLHLGLIALLFPRARIIHCRRDPRDSCLSCYFQHFNHLPFSFDLTNLAHYYRGYAEVMKHWRSVLPLPIFEVDYEQLVENQESVSRALVEHCGLDWDQQCLEFFKAERAVRTASLWQVRQPIYASSKARWRHYEPFLGPLSELFDLLPPAGD